MADDESERDDDVSADQGLFFQPRDAGCAETGAQYFYCYVEPPL